MKTLFRVVVGLALVLTAVTTLTGCSSFDGEKVRAEHARDYPKALAETTAQMISPAAPLGLEDCIRIALENNLQVRSAEIQARIAKLDRKIAFANFLPQLSVSYSHYEFDPSLSIELSGEDPITIDKARSFMWQANASIFNPATWFLYSMRKRGAEIADLVTDYTRQMTVLEVTIDYYQCLSLEENEKALASELAAAVEMEKQLRNLSDEGLIRPWQADQAGIAVQARRIRRDQTRRSLTQAKANLLAALGLSPLAEITLRSETPLKPPVMRLEDLVLETLLNNRQLQISDRNVEIQKEQVKIALADFLPKLFGFVYRPESLEDFGPSVDQWIYGLSGTMTLFNGFTNVNEYKAARHRREASFLEREQATLSVILEAMRAYLTVATTDEQVALARNALNVATRRLAETEQQWHEGLVSSSDLLDVTAQRDNARAQAIAARFQHQVATATLLNIMGRTKLDYEELDHDGQSGK